MPRRTAGLHSSQPAAPSRKHRGNNFMANAMVIGMGGVGSVIAQKLHEYDCIDRIICADRDTVFAEQLAKRLSLIHI